MSIAFARPFTRHCIDSRILIVFLIVAIGGVVFLKLGSEVMEGDQFALDRLILQGLRRGTDPACRLTRAGSTPR